MGANPFEIARIELGTGVLSWARGERQTDRYGAVSLWSSPGPEAESLPFPHAPTGIHGRLVAVVLDTRISPHQGDFDRQLAPTTPESGEEITLGEGTLFTETRPDGTATLGLTPDDGRLTDWLEPRALYRTHHQTVRLELRDFDTDPAVLAAARRWLRTEGDRGAFELLASDDVGMMDNAQIIGSVDHYFPGGLAEFVRRHLTDTAGGAL